MSLHTALVYATFVPVLLAIGQLVSALVALN